jgi:hypothetical protein
MSRFPFFLVAAFLTCLGMIGFSVRALLPVAPKSVEARQIVGGLGFDVVRLNNIAPATGFPVTPTPGARGDQTGPRLASTNALSPDATNSKGARLALGPRTSASLEGRPISVIVALRGIPKSASTRMAVGIVGNGPVTWVEAAVPVDFAPIRIDLPPTQAPITALAIWPSTQGKGQGVEIRSITIQTPAL